MSLAAVSDRLAHDTTAGLELPPVTVQTAWAAMTPPRAGWEPVGSVDAEALVEAARAGIAEVAQGAPDGSGGQAVTDLRQRVWGRLTDTSRRCPRVRRSPHTRSGSWTRPTLRCDVVAHGRWTRLSSPRGHVLVR